MMYRLVSLLSTYSASGDWRDSWWDPGGMAGLFLFSISSSLFGCSLWPVDVLFFVFFLRLFSNIHLLPDREMPVKM